MIVYGVNLTLPSLIEINLNNVCMYLYMYVCNAKCVSSVRFWYRQRAVLQCGGVAVAGEGSQCLVAEYVFQCQGRPGE